MFAQQQSFPVLRVVGKPGTLLHRGTANQPFISSARAICSLNAGSSPSDPSPRHSKGSKSLIRPVQTRDKVSALRASSSSAPTAASGGSGGRPKDSPGTGGGGGEGSGSSDDAKALLLGAGKALETLPEDLLEGLKAGKLSKDIAQRYVNLQDSILAPLLNIGGFRERLLADPSFIVKLGIEVGIGVFTKSTAEYSKRGKHFWEEIDFVSANVAMAIVADFMLVWLPAPTLSFRRGGSALPGTQTALARFLANCPDNAFQRVQPGSSPFSLAQRTGAILRNGVKLLAVGAGSSLIGVGATQALSAARQFIDPSFHTPNPPQNIVSVSAAYASYMAVSSNLRYQLIAGVVEERGIEVLFKNNPRVCNLLSFAVRTGNTFAGSMMWVDYLRLLGMQPKGD